MGANREVVRDIGERLLRLVLLQVRWDTCKVSSAGFFDEEIEEAARSMKELGEGWEEWT
jgi:hypothetical protein